MQGHWQLATRVLSGSRTASHSYKSHSPTASATPAASFKRPYQNCPEPATLLIRHRVRGSTDRVLAVIRTDRGLLRSVLDPRCSVRECEATGYLGPAAKVRILRFKNLGRFRHRRGLQNHV